MIFLKISDFRILQEFTACNISVEEFRERLICDVLRRTNMVKWGFYYAVYDDLLAYVDDDETN